MSTLNESYASLLSTVINKEPVQFKTIFEDIMKEKARKYVGELEETIHKEMFNVTEDDESNEEGKNDDEDDEAGEDKTK